MAAKEMPIAIGPIKELSTVCEPVEQIDDRIKELAERMLETMYQSNGCGLAAPQVGELIRMVVIDVDHEDGKHKNPYVLINPEIKVLDGEKVPFCEGCLSFPGLSIEIERPSHVVVEALNLNGELMRYEAEHNLMAVCLQHEIDHINGITMFDHLKPLARARAMAEYKEALAKGAKPGDTSID